MSSLKDFIRKNLNPITHEVLRRNRVTEIFIKEVIKATKELYFEESRKLPKYRDISMLAIHGFRRSNILSRITKPTIMWAFTWSTTIQGHDFWDNIEDQIIQEADNLR